MVASRTYVRNTDYMYSGNNILALADNSFTLACWCRPTSFSGSYMGLFGTWNSFQGNLLMGDVKYIIFYPAGTGIQSANNIYTFNTWQFIACTFDGGSGSGTLTIYIGTTPNNLASVASGTANVGGIPTNDSIVALGGYWSSDAATFQGQASHFHIYDRALSLAELTNIMVNPFTPLKGIKGFFPVMTSTATKELTANLTATQVGTLADSSLGAPYCMDAGGIM